MTGEVNEKVMTEKEISDRLNERHFEECAQRVLRQEPLRSAQNV